MKENESSVVTISSVQAGSIHRGRGLDTHFNTPLNYKYGSRLYIHHKIRVKHRRKTIYNWMGQRVYLKRNGSGKGVEIFNQFAHPHPIPRIPILFSKHVIRGEFINNAGPAFRGGFRKYLCIIISIVITMSWNFGFINI